MDMVVKALVWGPKGVPLESFSVDSKGFLAKDFLLYWHSKFLSKGRLLSLIGSALFVYFMMKKSVSFFFISAA